MSSAGSSPSAKPRRAATSRAGSGVGQPSDATTRMLSARPIRARPAGAAPPGADAVAVLRRRQQGRRHEFQRLGPGRGVEPGVGRRGNLAHTDHHGSSGVQRHGPSSVPVDAPGRSPWRSAGTPVHSVPVRPAAQSKGLHEQLRDRVGRRSRGGAPPRRGAQPAADDPAADRLGELHVTRGARRHGLGADEQVRRGLPRPALLRGQPRHRRGGGARPRSGHRPVRRRPRQRAAARRGQRQPRRLPGAARTGRDRPRHAARPRRPPDPRVARLHRLEVLALRVLRRHAAVGGRVEPGRGHRLRPGGPPRQDREAGSHRGGLDGLRPGDRPPALPGDRRLGRRALHVRRRPPGRPHRRRRPPEPGRRGRRRHAHHPQDAARPARGRHPVRGGPGQEDRQRGVPRAPGRPARARHRGQGGGLRRGGAAGVPPVRRGGRRQRGRPGRSAGRARVPARLGRHRQPHVAGRPATLRPGADREGGPGGPGPGRHHLQPQHHPRRPPLPVPHLRPPPRNGRRDDGGHGHRRDAAGGRPHRAHAQGPDRRRGDRRGALGGRRCSAPPSRRIPISWPDACPTSAGTAWSW